MSIQPDDYVQLVKRHTFEGYPYDEAPIGTVGIVVERSDEANDAWIVDWIKYPEGSDLEEESSQVDEDCLERVVWMGDKAYPVEVQDEELDQVYALLGVPMQRSLFDADSTT